MFKIYTVLPVGFTSNSYLLTADNQTAVAIDPSGAHVLHFAKEHNLKITAVLLTHVHFDHVGACETLRSEGVPVYCAATERWALETDMQTYSNYGLPMPKITAECVLKDGDELSLAGIKIKVIATPGHSAGSVTYLVENHLFVGDTLFEGSVGRTDLPTGDWNELQKSVKKLYALAGDYTVYCGHGDPTTLDRERKYNPYVRA